MKMLFLGAARHQVPAIEAALLQGFDVYTADNAPGNPGHRLAREAFDVSAADVDAVAALAGRLKVDGVLGYASEVCARTAARVAWRLGLPGSPPDAVEALSFKDAFREITQSTGLQPLTWRSFWKADRDPAAEWTRSLRTSVVVKPVDSSGGRGVTVGATLEKFPEAFDQALAASRQGRVIVEEQVVPVMGQFGGDGWMEHGRLKFLHCFDNETLPAPDNGAAIWEMFPSRISHELQEVMRLHLEALLLACGYTCGPINFDGCFLESGCPFVFEIAPRSGGNFIPQQVQRQMGVDLTTACVLAAVDKGFQLPVPQRSAPGFHATWVVHTRRAGKLRSVTWARELDPFLAEHVPYVGPGAMVRPFATSGDALGMLLLKFPSRETMQEVMARLPELCHINLEPTL
ncbi:MAG TPA: hypothetical protein VK956_00480 [Verrucomicrobium sp.]|nr:hypothetical protein [Verrucomicrobium sp.]